MLAVTEGPGLRSTLVGVLVSCIGMYAWTTSASGLTESSLNVAPPTLTVATHFGGFAAGFGPPTQSLKSTSNEMPMQVLPIFPPRQNASFFDPLVSGI